MLLSLLQNYLFMGYKHQALNNLQNARLIDSFKFKVYTGKIKGSLVSPQTCVFLRKLGYNTAVLYFLIYFFLPCLKNTICNLSYFVFMGCPYCVVYLLYVHNEQGCTTPIVIIFLRILYSTQKQAQLVIFRLV